MGSALSAFGIELGTFVGREIHARVGENADPWPYVDQVFKDPQKALPRHLSRQIGTTLADTWKGLAGERRALLQLLSRFEITPEQAKLLYVRELRKAASIDCSDSELISNPYLLYEVTRHTTEPISVWTADAGLFPGPKIREEHPLPDQSAPDGATDRRRIRALTVSILDKVANAGHTLLPQGDVIRQIRELDAAS